MGTSYVSGVAALYLESNPAATPAEVSAALVNFATNDVITGLDVSSPNKLLYSMSYLATSAPTSTSAAPTAAPTTEGTLQIIPTKMHPLVTLGVDLLAWCSAARVLRLVRWIERASSEDGCVHVGGRARMGFFSASY